jgi:NAD(P)-dependent dehydrogenase (short-subunit alcohol dehydrogenase family)
MSTVLITGASRGLGLEFAKQYAADGWRVIATVRDPKKAGSLQELGSSVGVHRLDVRDFKATAELGRELAREAIDVVIANAGISPGHKVSIAEVDEDAWLDTFAVNSVAPMALAGALLPALKRGEAKKLIAITSRMGSIAENTAGGSYPYRASKAALNAAWHSLANDHREVIAVVLHPGWVRTDMGGSGAPVAPKESITGMRRVIAKLTPADSGKFFDFEGKALPW